MTTPEVSTQSSGDLYSYLNKWANQVQTSINENTNVAAAQEIALAIENTKVAREKDWKTSLEEIEKVAEEPIHQLKQMVAALEKNDQEVLGKLEVKKYVDALNYGYAPKLTASPKTVAAGSLEDIITLKFAGVYPYGASRGYEPSLIVNGKTYKVGQEGCKGTTDTLEFKIKAADIISQSASNVGVELQVPWENGSFWSSDKRVATYELSFRSLPTSPGTITAVYRTKAGHVIQEPFVSSTIKFQATLCNKEWITRKTIIKPNEGYKFNTQTPFVKHQGTWLGEHDVEPTLSVKPNQIEVSMKLGADSGANLGRAEFIVQAMEERTLPKMKRKEEVSIALGQNYVLDIREGEELARVKITTFDGQEVELNETNKEHPLLKLVVEEGKYTLEAAKPESLIS